MALVKDTLKADILKAFDKQKNKTSDADAALNDLAALLADAVDKYIKSATVTVAAGIPVATAGSPTAQTGTTTAPATGTIS